MSVAIEIFIFLEGEHTCKILNLGGVFMIMKSGL